MNSHYLSILLVDICVVSSFLQLYDAAENILASVSLAEEFLNCRIYLLLSIRCCKTTFQSVGPSLHLCW